MRPVGIARVETAPKQPGTATLMELRQLRYFVTLAEELHFGRAADRLGIAQPSLSTQIQALEAGLSAQLLSRGPRSVALTPAGAVFLEEARLTLAQADRAVAVGRRAGRGELGIVRIGLALGSTLSGVPSIIMSQYRRHNPEIELQLSILSPNRQVEGLRGGALDVGFLLPPSAVPEGLEFMKLFSEKHTIALSRDHPLAAKKSIHVAKLADESFLVMHPESSNGIYESTMKLGQHGGFTPRITRIERDLIALLSLVGAGFGVLLLTESVCRINMPNVVYRRLRGLSTTIGIAAAFRRNEAGTPIRSFLECCAAYAKTNGPR
jgi:DNA-binding transcriptional LysR family regulator